MVNNGMKKAFKRLAVVFLALSVCVAACACAKKLTVTFDPNPPAGIAASAVTGMPAKTTAVKKGAMIAKPAAPHLNGRTFGGWYKADGSEWDFKADKVKKDTTLYAKWE